MYLRYKLNKLTNNDKRDDLTKFNDLMKTMWTKRLVATSRKCAKMHMHHRKYIAGNQGDDACDVSIGHEVYASGKNRSGMQL